MKWISVITLSAVFLAVAATGSTAEDGRSLSGNGQTVVLNGTQPRFNGPDQYFTGNVKINMLFSPTKELPASGAFVTFEPGARSAWHTHPAGQTLVVTSGTGLTQEWGGPVVEIRPGDVVKCPANVKHWHGASPNSAMTHLAITGDRNGKNVEWMEKVTDAQYRAK